MRRSYPVVLFALLLLVTASCRDVRIHDHPEWGDIFQRYGVTDGCFIMRDHSHETIHYYNKDRCIKRYSPASTFKIMSALVALETGVAKDETFVLPWDSVVRPIVEWNQPMSMIDAFKKSNVGYFQELVRRIGRDEMQHALDTVKYGNMHIGPVLDAFWLNDSLQISADEQIGFLRKLYFDELPFTNRSQQIVRYMMQQEETPEYKLAYKTGWSSIGGKAEDVLWIVGWVERVVYMKEHEGSMNVADHRNYPYFFALNFSTSNKSIDYWKDRRIALLKEVLVTAGAIPGAGKK